ncbi:MAG TPA: MaoC family dehydratase [Burkholderiaceae bacterium]|nr:MaoC family dehydratase [Burkholderiaceae bacterium]
MTEPTVPPQFHGVHAAGAAPAQLFSRTDVLDLAALAARVGETLVVSDWFAIDQARVNAFAEATEDRQWIHVHPERAAAGPFGATVAHGFLTLSMIPMFFEQSFPMDQLRMGVNYGLDRVRFPAPLAVGKRIRAHFKLLDVQAVPALPPATQGAQLKFEVTIEAEGAAKPVCVAEPLVRWYT